MYSPCPHLTHLRFYFLNSIYNSLQRRNTFAFFGTLALLFPSSPTQVWWIIPVLTPFGLLPSTHFSPYLIQSTYCFAPFCHILKLLSTPATPSPLSIIHFTSYLNFRQHVFVYVFFPPIVDFKAPHSLPKTPSLVPQNASSFSPKHKTLPPPPQIQSTPS